MKKTLMRISIVIAVVSSFAYCLFFAPKQLKPEVYAAGSSINCFTLIGDDGELYESIYAVGQINGTGIYEVGDNNIKLTATANHNFQIVGWQITYLEQSNKTEYINSNGLTDFSKTIKLTPKGVTKEEDKVEAILTFNKELNSYVSSSFEIVNIFEDLEIKPVFDHIYYQVEIDELLELTTHKNNINCGIGDLFYEEATVGAGVTTYKKSYIKIDNKFYYYGNVVKSGTKFYTSHKKNVANEEYENIDISKGAFRYGEIADIDFNVDINEVDIYNSKNIDFQSVIILSDVNTTLPLKTSSQTKEYYTFNNDKNLLRTTNYHINFEIKSSSDYINKIDISYHNLYVVDLQFKVDGGAPKYDIDKNIDEVKDILGDLNTDSANETIGNISLYNFHSKVGVDDLKYLVKASKDNGSKAFRITCLPSIRQDIDGETYTYYNFDSLDSMNLTSKNYENINSNTKIVINYVSTLHEVSFELAEYAVVNLQPVLLALEGKVLDSIYLKRFDDNIFLNSDSVKDLSKTGYEFKGFALSPSSVQSTFTYDINNEKPSGLKIIICFQKIEYQIKFTNFNKVNLDGKYPLSSVTFNKIDGAANVSQNITSSELSDATGGVKDINFKLKIGEGLSIGYKATNGFEILGFGLAYGDILTKDENDVYSFELTEKLITDYSLTDTITIYVFEKIEYFTLTYFINLAEDTVSKTDVIMAKISVDVTDNVKKFDVENKEINTINGNLDAAVAKIEISNLKLGDELLLMSEPFKASQGHTYMFNYFVADGGKIKLSAISGTTNYKEKITRDREIEVVYSMPVDRVEISIDEYFANNPDFSFEIDVSGYSNEVKKGESYIVRRGEILTISITNVAFGYDFIGYNGIKLETDNFEYKAMAELNEIVLNFEAIDYYFKFIQHDTVMGLLTETPVNFDDKDFATLNIDSYKNIVFEKTFEDEFVGYYVATVEIEGDNSYSSLLSENNDYRSNDDLNVYKNFKNLSRDQFIQICKKSDASKIVEVDIYYLVFTYTVKVEMDLTNPKGDSRDNKVIYPQFVLEYHFNGADVDKTSNVLGKIASYDEVPYGAKNCSITLNSKIQKGIVVEGWKTSAGTLISNNANQLDIVIEDEIIESDYNLKYHFKYEFYQVKIEYDKTKGNPLINDSNISPTMEISLFDSLNISAGANRNAGYRFASFKYNVPTYTKYDYVAEEWDAIKYYLYIKNNDEYIPNIDSNYFADKEYFISDKQEFKSSENLTISSFDFDAYELTWDSSLNKHVFKVVIDYALIELTINNKINSTLDNLSTSIYLTEVGLNGIGDLEIAPNHWAMFEMKAQNPTGIRDVIEGDIVTVKDDVTVLVRINKEANNNDDVFDLSKGVSLSRVYVGGEICSFETIKTEDGLVDYYSIKISVLNYMPVILGNEISVEYVFGMGNRTIRTTTYIQNESFYSNFVMTINTAAYSFGIYETENGGTSETFEDGLQFLAKVKVVANFKESFKSSFKISGMSVYVNGKELDPKSYSYYGIDPKDNNDIYSFDVRMIDNLEIVYKVQPILKINELGIYEKEFNYVANKDANGKITSFTQEKQTLTVGSSASDIIVPNIISNYIKITYIDSANFEHEAVSSVGSYTAKISFMKNNQYPWVEELKVYKPIKLVIIKKQIYLNYDSLEIGRLAASEKSQEYDRNSEWDISKLNKLLCYTDIQGNVLMKYSDIINVDSDFILNLDNAEADVMDKSDPEKTTTKAGEGYTVRFKGFKLKSVFTNDFNSNLELKNEILDIKNYATISKKTVRILGLKVNDKVYDETTNATLASAQLQLTDVFPEDTVMINLDNLVLNFTNPDVGRNKTVKLETENLLKGESSVNYTIAESSAKVTGVTIYPYSVSTYVDGIGEISLLNKRGLTDVDKVDLIPIHSVLKVKTIKQESIEYPRIYKYISEFMKGNHEMAIGYILTLYEDGGVISINQNLHLSVPNVDKLKTVVFLSGEKTEEIAFETDGNNVIIDLSQVNFDVQGVFMIRKKVLLKPWQIVLIVLSVVLVISGTVLAIVIIRKRKFSVYSSREKI